MAQPILVIGLAGRHDLSELNGIVAGRTILARSRRLLPADSPPGWTVAASYDDWFERKPLAGIADAIAADIVARAETASVAYLVPGVGALGDETVAELSHSAPITIISGHFESSPVGHAQVIDALTLAVAQEAEPHEAGSPPLEATAPLVVLNWHGSRVIDRAKRRLRAICGVDDLPQSDRFGTLRLPGRDSLDGPPSFHALAAIVARLRRPDGCPWDREQTHASLLAGFASEVEEFTAAVNAEDWPNAAEELGDILLNVLMQTQIGAESDHFTIEDALAGVNSKLVRRHPHVFAGVEASSPNEVLAVWKQVKQQEKRARDQG